LLSLFSPAAPWPLAASLGPLARQRGLFLHLPAHRRGAAAPPGRPRLPWAWDLPELPELGGPLLAEGAVAASQRRLAAELGANHSWYGVNGASGLLQAALLGAVPPGGRVLLPRNLHRSLLHGCLLGGLEPLFYAPPLDPATGLGQPLPPNELEQLLAAAGELDLLVLVSPTYQGLAADLPALVALAQGRGLPVLVDEAHGGHFGLDPSLPCGALAAGADLVVQSLHKSLGGLGQTALLHLQGPRLAPEAIEQALLWLQTSSPSALLMLSAERALAARLAPRGRRQLSLWLHQARALGDRLRRGGLPLLPNQDPLRLVLDCGALGLTGLAADDWLMARRVVAECPEPLSLTFCLGMGSPRGLERPLAAALGQLRQAWAGADPLPPLAPAPLPALARLAVPLAQAWRAPAVELPLAEAVGRIAARPLCPYPPGIPLLLPGERLDRPRLDWLEGQRQLWAGQIADRVTVLA
jgi:lysine decarboxylase